MPTNPTVSNNTLNPSLTGQSMNTMNLGVPGNVATGAPLATPAPLNQPASAPTSFTPPTMPVQTPPDTGAIPVAGAAPVAGANDPNSQPATPEQQAALMQALTQLKSKQGEMNATVIANQNKSELTRQKLVMEVFGSLIKSGVDPSDINQVRQYLITFQQNNPDLYNLFVQSFNVILGGEMGNQDISNQVLGTQDTQGQSQNQNQSQPISAQYSNLASMQQPNQAPLAPPVTASSPGISANTGLK